uniref:Mic1 domain-containing protein n=1 Tax=Palpitomonas bilix TaxID=652834 RepID=A0A7S3DE77_9EUKA|mmetsp:Transcript_33647/g.86202  ORF Transcript_33647/g.86202 Transcript_33647/m.86202 type:complete len:815 (+) Transcript_33647:233-2677(+)
MQRGGRGPSISHVHLQERIVRFEDATLTGATECCFDEASGVFVSYTGKALYFYPAATAMSSSVREGAFQVPQPFAYKNPAGGCLLAAKLSPCFKMVALHFAREPKKIRIVNLVTSYEFEITPTPQKISFSFSSSSHEPLTFAFFNPTSAAACPASAAPAAPDAWSSAPFHLRRDVKQKRPARKLDDIEGGTPRKPLILGFFWLDEVDEVEDARLCLISTVAFEAVSFTGRALQEKKSSKVLKATNIRWYAYDPRLRLVLLSMSPAVSAITGLDSEKFGGEVQPLSVMAFQLQKKSKGGLLKLPRFDLPPDDPSCRLTKNVPLQVHTPVLFPIDLYGVPFCAHLSVKNKELVLYHLGREVVSRKLSIPLGMNMLKNRIRVVSVDNLLLVFFAETKLTLLFDIRAAEQSPVAAPLPIFAPTVGDRLSQAPMMDAPWRLFGRGLVLAPDCDHLDEEREREGELPDAVGEAHRREISMIGEQVDSRVSTTSSVWTIGLNLEGIVASSTDRIANIHFLLRRANGKKCLVGVLKAAVKDGGVAMSNAFRCVHDPFYAQYEYDSEKEPQRWSPNGVRYADKSFDVVNNCEVAVEAFDGAFPNELRVEDSPILNQRSTANAKKRMDPREEKVGKRNRDGDLLFSPHDALKYVFEPLRKAGEVSGILIANAALEYSRAADTAMVKEGCEGLTDLALELLAEAKQWHIIQMLLQTGAIPTSRRGIELLQDMEKEGYSESSLLLISMLGKYRDTNGELVLTLLRRGEVSTSEARKRETRTGISHSEQEGRERECDRNSIFASPLYMLPFFLTYIFWTISNTLLPV